jgi:P27 family predicted phage terminase small subunit
MGKRGPRATPLVLKILKGNPSQENLGDIEKRSPKSAAAGADAPPDLTGAALAKWIESVPMLSTMRVWGESERETWARYCRVYALWWACYQIVQTLGQTYEKPSGVIAPRPETLLLIQYNVQLIRLECEFGLTPASRSSATVRETESDPMAEFLREA